MRTFAAGATSAMPEFSKTSLALGIVNTSALEAAPLAAGALCASITMVSKGLPVTCLEMVL